MIPWWKQLDHDLQCGLHSGLPLCCVLFYVLVWARIRQGRFTRWYMQQHESDYIPCPLCVLRGREVRVAECGCNGGTWLERT